MSTLTAIAKNSGSLAGSQKPSTGEVFYGWLFWFTHPIFNTTMTAVSKNSGSLTGFAKH